MRNAPLIFIVIVVLCLSSCKTTNPTGVVGDHQRQVAQLEERNTELERRLALYDSTVGSSIRSLENIRGRSLAMEGTVDELIELFRQYQFRVDQLIYDYHSITTAVTDDS
jgi:hypothetical protein